MSKRYLRPGPYTALQVTSAPYRILKIRDLSLQLLHLLLKTVDLAFKRFRHVEKTVVQIESNRISPRATS